MVLRRNFITTPFDTKLHCRGTMDLSVASLYVFVASLLAAAVYAASAVTDVCAKANNEYIYKKDEQCKNAGGTFKNPDFLPDSTPPLPSKWCECSSKRWSVGRWRLKVPISTSATCSPPYTNCYPVLSKASGATAPFISLKSAVVSRQDCCGACTAANTGTNPTTGAPLSLCSYWLHVVLPLGAGGGSPSCSDPSNCGYCIIFPPGTKPELDTQTCSTASSSNFGRRMGNYSTVGKGCAGAKNDPHFVGAQGTHFDFNGTPDQSFCLVTDRTFHVNMRMRGYYDTRTVGASVLRDGLAVRTWIKDLGLLWLDPATGVKHSLLLSARDGKSSAREDGYMGRMALDGSDLPRMHPGDMLSLVAGLTLTMVGYEKEGSGFFDVDVYKVSIAKVLMAEVKLRVAHPLLQTAEDAMAHINVQFLYVEHGGSTHGVLGQTFRPGREKRAVKYSALAALVGKDVSVDTELGKGFLDGSASDYRTSNVLATDCRYSAFSGQPAPLV